MLQDITERIYLDNLETEYSFLFVYMMNCLKSEEGFLEKIRMFSAWII
jgi:hypothetical protein